eukprot:jgi/Ulvmu1/10822/UM069_0058.1
MIRQVFKDNTDLDLKRGTVVSVESSLFGNLCGFALDPGTQYIIFANTPFMPEDDEDDASEPIAVAAEDDADDATPDEDDGDDVKPARRLLQTRTASVRVTAQAVEGAQVSARGFSDGVTCEIPSGDLTTSLCSGNIVDPKRKDVEELAAGCAALMEDDDVKDD